MVAISQESRLKGGGAKGRKKRQKRGKICWIPRLDFLGFQVSKTGSREPKVTVRLML
jgi:hypothetical protein